MDARDLKRILAGIAISSLLAGPALVFGGSAGGGKSGCSGADKGAGSAPAEQKKAEQAPGKSEGSRGETDNAAVSVPATQEKPEQPPGKSG
jgi:hypothetical protein